MADLLTAEQMRATEAEAIASGRVTGLELMERAGRGVVEAVFEAWPDLAATSHRAVVLCGPGNNGGDGFVVARLLAHWGWEVEVFLYGAPDKLPPDARRNFERWQAIGSVADLETYPGAGGDCDLCVDAMFGTGLTRALEGVPARVLAGLAIAAQPQTRLVCIDIPSGLCADSGTVLGRFDPPLAALTVTFHTPKLGHVLQDGPRLSGRLAVVDIGLPDSARAQPDQPARDVVSVVGRPDQTEAALWTKGAGATSGHKYTHGHALVLSGPMGRSGAARLAARAALRVGAGLVTVAAPGAAMMECATQLTAIMLRKCDGAAGLAALLADARINALCLGPGLGVGEGTRALVAAALADRSRAVVLDADALTSFAEAPDMLFAQLHGGVVLTPHAGEFARLFPDLSASAATGPAVSKVDVTRAAAQRAGCVVLFKGPDTVIADPSGRCAVHAAAYDRAAPWLATAGSGDVLAGLITGLRARGLGPMQAAEIAAYLHVEAARAFGPGLIAEDLPEMLPQVLRDLGASANENGTQKGAAET